MRRLKRSVTERLGIGRLGSDVAALRQENDALRQELDEAVQQSQRATADRDRRLADVELHQRISAATAWATTAPLRHEPLISVVLATRDRADLVPAAIESVRGQRYPHWELVVVDDGSTDATPEVLTRCATSDDRIVVETTAGVGVSAARNAGIARSTGEWIAFVDDDNAMAPDWLRAIAEYTGRVPGTDALYGAALREDHVDLADAPRLLFPTTLDVEALRVANSIDLGVLAVRAGHEHLHFDETLDRYVDWDLVLRLAESGVLRPVPVIASLYSVRAANRISAAGDDDRLTAMQRRFAR